jgi:hypothetical protein
LQHGGKEAAAKVVTRRRFGAASALLALNRIENPVSFPTRRTFLKTALAAAASVFLPRFLLARAKPRSFWFLHATTGESWPVDDPVAWALENAHQPILERASAGLLKLTPADDQRIIRLVVRRCKFNLLEIGPGRVVVHYWGQQGQADLHPFFKQHGLARNDVRVTLIDRKRETSTVQTGDAFLYGERVSEKFPLGAYLEKWRQRAIEEPDDWTAAPCSGSNYCWEGIEQRRIPWRVLKAAWQKEKAPLCRNCDKDTILTAFGYFVCGFYKRGPIVVRICPLCRSRFEDHSPWDGPAWMLANLDEPLLPSADLMFGNPVKYTLPWTAEGQAHELNCRLVKRLNEIKGARDGFYADTGGHIGWLGNRRDVIIPPFDGPLDGVEEWCRQVIRLIADEE